jgi:hypothetical protein
MKKILILFIIVLLSGCVPQVKTTFVVSRDVPNEPSFTVLPFNNYYKQIEFANRVEAALIELGVKVIKYNPQPKEITRKMGIELEADQEAADIMNIGEIFITGKKEEAIAIETFIHYGEVKSNYIIYTDLWSERIKVVKKDSLEVLASFIVTDSLSTEDKEYNFKKVIRDALESLGIPVRELQEPQKSVLSPASSSSDGI